MGALMRNYLEQACQVMQGSLTFCSADLPDLRELAGTVITEHASRIMDQVAGPDLPWLALPILTCEALGSADRLPAACHVAAAWELGNLAAACLDAWQDEDTDGALWRQVGPKRTVNLAVGLIALSLQTLSSLAEAELLPVPAVLDLQRGFHRTLLRMAEGQHMDLGDDLDLDAYPAVAAAKTGSLFRLGCWSGAVVAAATPPVAERYGDFGQALGLLIQAWNDLYGLEGALGKQDVGHKRTLPILASLAMTDGAREPRAAQGEAAGHPGGKLYALMQVSLYHQQAAAALARCPAPGRLSQFLDAYSVSRLAVTSEGQDG